MIAGKYTLSFTDSVYDIALPQDATYAQIDMLRENGEVHHCAAEITLKTLKGETVATVEDAQKVLSLFQSLAEPDGTRKHKMLLYRNLHYVGLRETRDYVDGEGGLKTQDIFARMKEGKFTDRLLQDMAKEFGLPSQCRNLPDTLINMAACSSKEAACFWLADDAGGVLKTLPKIDSEKLLNVLTDSHFCENRELLFDSIIEVLKHVAG